MSDTQKKSGERKQIKLYSDLYSSNNYNVDTDCDVSVTPVVERIIVDAHMHIMSNNCTPLPLQWNAIAVNNPLWTNRHIDERVDMTDMAAGFPSNLVIGRFGKIGRLPTDLIANLCLNNLSREQLRQDSEWILSEISRDEYKEKAKNEINDMNIENNVKREKFYDLAKYYFDGSKLHVMSYAMMFDLSFCHYWGKYHIPINIITETSGDTDYYSYINDYIALKSVAELNEGREKTISFDEKVINPCDKTENIWTHRYIQYEKVTRHLFYDFNLKEQYELFKAGQDSLICFDDDPEMLKAVSNDKMKHFVRGIPNETNKRFEDYYKQQDLSLSASLKSGLKILLFYHYDPRRHCSVNGGEKGKAQWIDKTVKEINTQHEFFTYEGKNHEKKSSVNYVVKTVYDNGLLLKRAHIDFRKSLSRIITNEDIMPQFVTITRKGLYWGVKMYTAMGYKPDSWDLYPHLKKFYKFCADNQIPITCHCSPGGMMVGDEHNYLRAELKLKQPYHSNKTRHDYFNNEMVSPAAWGKVLKEFPSLRVCLAHFGGGDIWEEKWKHEGKSYKKWVDDIIDMMETYENFYTDISYFTWDSSLLWSLSKSKRVCERMVKLITDHEGIKKKIISGTDWYMTEMDESSNYVNYSGQFKLLREVTRSLNKGWDVYHQFAVINPLRFIGLLDDNDDGAEEYKIDCTKLENYLGAIKDKLTEDKFCENKLIDDDDKDGIPEQIEKLIASFKGDFRIQNSNKVLDKDNKLVIIGD